MQETTITTKIKTAICLCEDIAAKNPEWYVQYERKIGNTLYVYIARELGMDWSQDRILHSSTVLLNSSNAPAQLDLLVATLQIIFLGNNHPVTVAA